MTRNILPVFAILAAPVWSQPSHTPIAVPTTISSPGAYLLRSSIDFNAAAGAGITITASGVTLDLNGFEIRGPGGKQGTGVRILGAKGVTVRNGGIADTAFGVIVENSHNVILTDLRVRGQALPVVTAPPEVGIMILNGRNVVVERTAIYDTGLGIFVRGPMSSGNRIAANTVTTSVNGVFGICYNPAATGTGGPRGDLIEDNVITGFETAIQVSAGSVANVFRQNLLAYLKEAYISANSTNLDSNNVKVQLP
ncbi:MAG: right-handed parallel beta-helix repeat-containing protein [Gammaproteobacteria bacterium]